MALQQQTFPSADAMAQAAAHAIAAALAQAIAERGAALFIATGGGTAPAIYGHLASAALDWARVTVTLSDDRQVPADHAASNLRLLREALLVGPAQAARCVALTDAAIEGLSWPADACLLGMGADLHIASIFPNGAGMAAAMEARTRVIETRPDPLPANAPYARLTLSLPTIAASRAIWLCFTGAEKIAALAAAGPAAPVLALAARAGDRMRVMRAL